MKRVLMAGGLAVMFLTGCHKPRATERTAANRPPVSQPGSLTESADAPPPPPGSAGTVSTASGGGESPDMVAVQQAVNLFKEQKMRWPYSVAELVSQKLIAGLPQLPPGKAIYVDQASGKIHIDSAP